MKRAQRIVLEAPRRVVRPAGRTFVVTGGTSGVGRATAMALIRAGGRVVLPIREGVDPRKVRAEIATAGTPAQVEAIHGDLASRESLEAFVARVGETHPQLHGLLNCAGLLLPERRLGPDGTELMFAVEYLGHFLLANRLAGALRAGAPSRILTLAGERHRRGRDAPRVVDLDNLQGEKSFRPGSHAKHLALAKILFTRELARRLEGTGVEAFALSPGPTRSGRYRHLPLGRRIVAGAILALRRAQPPEAAAGHLLYAVTERDLDSSSGGYLVGSRSGIPAPAARNPDAARRLWDATETLLGARFLPPPGADA